MFIKKKLLFSNHTIQEYASSETVRAITAAIEKDLWATGTVNDEYLKALNSLFSNFPRLRTTSQATIQSRPTAHVYSNQLNSLIIILQ